MKEVYIMWSWIQNEVLGMKWLYRLIGGILESCGLDTSGRIGGSIQFFFYDTIKIMVLLGGNNPFGVIIATVAGVPMYADIFGTIPIAEALLAKGALLGVVLSFMMGVTTLSLPSVIMLRKAVKPKLLGIFVAICTVGIILVGYFFNTIQNFII